MQTIFIRLAEMFLNWGNFFKRKAQHALDRSHARKVSQNAERDFLALVKPPVLQQKAKEIFHAYTAHGISGMDLSMAYGWMRVWGKSESKVIEILSNYLRGNPTGNNIRELILQHIIVRPGAFKEHLATLPCA